MRKWDSQKAGRRIEHQSDPDLKLKLKLNQERWQKEKHTAAEGQARNSQIS